MILPIKLRDLFPSPSGLSFTHTCRYARCRKVCSPSALVANTSPYRPVKGEGSGLKVMRMNHPPVGPPQGKVNTPSPPGGRWGWGEEVLSSPPPAPSPIKGEESSAKATRMRYLPLSAVGLLAGAERGEWKGAFHLFLPPQRETRYGSWLTFRQRGVRARQSSGEDSLFIDRYSQSENCYGGVRERILREGR
jgi:hypothetical protein